MPYPDGLDIYVKEEPGDTLRRDKSGYKATRRFMASGIKSTLTNVIEILEHAGVPAYDSVYPYATVGTSRLKAKSISIEEIENADIPLFSIVVDYEYSPSGSEMPTDPEDGGEYYEYEFTSDTVKVNTGKSQSKYPATAPDMDLTIGVGQDGEVSGVDVYDNSEVLTVILWKTKSAFNQTYVNNVRAELNKVNSGAWYGSSAGEALFRGMRKVSDNEFLVELEFTFLISRNRSSVELPTFSDKDGTSFTITGGKKGWEYLWSRSLQVPLTTGVVNRTEGVYVAQVYDESDFSGLGLSGSV